MRSEELFEKCHEIGPAIWLLMLYWAASDPEEMPWFIVMHGDPLSDQEVSAYLSVSVHTAARWRKKLQRTGFVQAESRAGGFCIRVQRPRFALAALRALEEHARSRWPKLATEMVQ